MPQTVSYYHDFGKINQTVKIAHPHLDNDTVKGLTRDLILIFDGCIDQKKFTTEDEEPFQHKIIIDDYFDLLDEDDQQFKFTVSI